MTVLNVYCFVVLIKIFYSFLQFIDLAESMQYGVCHFAYLLSMNLCRFVCFINPVGSSLHRNVYNNSYGEEPYTRTIYCLPLVVVRIKWLYHQGKLYII